MRSGGFFAGAVGGLALALLLVGAVSFLPQSGGGAPQAASTQGQSQPEGAAVATSTSVSTTATSACFASPAPQAPCAPPSPPSLATINSSSSALGGLAVSGNVAVSGSPSLSSSGNGSSPPAASASKAAALQKPSSLLAAIPGEGVGTLLATVSPLLIGFLVAALVYGAYVRRQDSPA